VDCDRDDGIDCLRFFKEGARVAAGKGRGVRVAADKGRGARGRSRLPGGRPALLYRYPDPIAADGAILVLVREHDQTVYSIQVERIENFQTREGVRFGSSEALVRASFGKPQSVGETTVAGQDGATAVMRIYCYLNGIAVRLDANGNVEALTVFPGGDLRKICKAQ